MHNVHQNGTMTLQRSRALEFAKLAKPELTMLSVMTAVGGAFLASTDGLPVTALMHTLVGTAMAGGAAGTLNQLFEREHDAQMKRTENRPLPAGRVQPHSALIFGLLLAAGAIVYLWLTANATAALLALITIVSYLFIYTPLKRRTPFATVVGGIPGALPPLIGWAVVRNGVSLDAWSLFFILFFWQMPHFLALGWLYRKDYARAGYRLLTVLDLSGEVTCRQILIYAAALVPASLMPTLVGLSGYLYFVAAFILSAAFLRSAVHLWYTRTNAQARKLFLASLVYLPALFGVMMVDRLLR